jgi:hypothetical protein
LTRTGSGWHHYQKRRRHWRLWLDHEHRCCSLGGRDNNLVFGSVDNGAATNGRVTQTNLCLEKKKQQEDHGYISGAPSKCPSPPSAPPASRGRAVAGRGRAEARRAEFDGAGCGSEWHLCSSRTEAGSRRRAGKEGRSSHGAAVCEQGQAGAPPELSCHPGGSICSRRRSG